jgi:hypothetical protein
MLERPIVIQDNNLRRTSAWGNTFLGRDHFARRTAALDEPSAPASAPATPATPATPVTPTLPEKGPHS